MAEPAYDVSPTGAARAAAASIPNHPSALLTETQAAQVLSLSIRTLQAWRLKGSGPRFVRLSGRAVRYRNSDLAAFIEARTVASTSDPGAAVVAPSPVES